MKIIREGAQLGSQELIIETGRMANLAHGAVVVQYGDSQVLCTAVADSKPKDVPFLPLTVNYQENFWAAGKIPGGYLKREGRPSDKATLTSRLIDRPCRPLFPEGWNFESQLIAWVISADRVNDTDVLGITGCSAALMISDIPWAGPLAGVRVGMIDGEFVANPTFAQRSRSEMDIVLAISPDAIVMVEGQANAVPESVMLEALEFGQESVKDVLALQLDLAKAVGKEKRTHEPPSFDGDIMGAAEKFLKKKIVEVVTIPDKTERYRAQDELKKELVASLSKKFEGREDEIKEAFGKIKKNTVRQRVAKTGDRIDGRRPDEIRPISVEVGIVPRAHGSALFTRGETQALVTTTLGTEKDQQRVDMLEGDTNRPFMLHYNFPPFSVGEARFLRGTSRRELGHGTLAERALTPTLPVLHVDFPYTVRVVSDVLMSNGSSSMASVCGGSLAMMDAGVPIKDATAGVAMGLIKEGDDIVILSDILGDEDHLGDMDFKVCGTADGITAFQLDTKIAGITRETMANALSQARAGIDHILGKMNAVISEPRSDVSEIAPRIVNIKIAQSAIGLVIGSGGSTIRGIQEATGTSISIDDSGTVTIASADATSTQQAIEIIEGLTAEPETGKIYMGTVKKIVEFGAFVEILPGRDGLLHISELTEGRVNQVEDVLREGDEVMVKCLEVGRGGKIRLSRKAALADQAEKGGDEEE
jgi:polyribonucleotide nucleotidyltransferase